MHRAMPCDRCINVERLQRHRRADVTVNPRAFVTTGRDGLI